MDLLAELLVERFGAVLGLGDHFHVGLRIEHAPEAGADDRVVVGDQDSGHEGDRHKPGASATARSRAGTSSRTSTPPSGAGLIASAASTSRARSRMLRSPPCSIGVPMQPRAAAGAPRTTPSCAGSR